MSVIVAAPDGSRKLIAKGAVEEIFGVCTDVAQGERPPAARRRGAARRRWTLADGFARDGLRVVAVADASAAGDAGTATRPTTSGT